MNYVTSTTSNINTPGAILRVLHALNLRRGEVTDKQLAELEAILTEFAIDSMRTAGGGI